MKSQYVRLSDNPILGEELDPQDPHINSYGLRVPEIQVVKPSRTFRIVALGDSVTFGCCTEPLAQGYPFYLKKLIQPPSDFFSDIEVINAGVVGYNTIQEAEFYQAKIKRLEPDFLILQVTLNDWEPRAFQFDDLINQLPVPEQQISRTFFDFMSKWPKYLSKSLLFQHLAYFTVTHAGNQLAINSESQSVLGAQTDETLNDWERTQIIRDGFDKLNAELTPNLKGKVLVVIFPDFSSNLVDYPQNFLNEHAYITKVAQNNNFDVLDLRSCYQADFLKYGLSFQGPDIRDTVHPGEYGHEVAAKCIAEYLKTKYGFK